MALIPLSGKNGKGLYAKVDDEDYDELSKIKWHLNDSGYAVNRKNGITTRMHRLVNKTPDGLFTDHKNHDRLDNRKFNLRTVTTQENMKNIHAKGIYWDKNRNRYIVSYKNKFGGRYETLEEAQIAYKMQKSGVPYVPQRRKLYNLPTGISKQFGKYRVRPQRDNTKYWLGQFSTIEEAQNALLKWQKEGY